MGNPLSQVMGVSPVLTTYVSWLCSPSFANDPEGGKWGFSADARADRLSEFAKRLMGSSDPQIDQRRVYVCIEHAQSIVEPYVEGVLEFLEAFGPPPRRRLVELPPHWAPAFEAGVADVDIVRAAWANRGGINYQDPAISPAAICIKVGQVVQLYKRVKRSERSGAASRVSLLTYAIGNCVSAADTREVWNACLAIDYIRMAEPDNHATTFRACTAILAEMLSV
jgi:hypothetical protein